MSQLNEMEKKVSTKRGKNSRFIVSLAVILALVGFGLVAGGINYLSNQVSANIETPPVPAVPTNATSTVTPPPVPPQPGSIEIPPLWSVIQSYNLQGTNFYSLLQTGVYIYSYNDPNFPDNKWTIYHTSNLDKIGGASALKAVNPLGYYVYNPTSTTIKPSLQSGDNVSTDSTYGSGWHLIYWSGDAAVTKDELLLKIGFTYADGKTLSGKDAISQTYHQVSPRLFVIMDEHSIDKTKAIKELTAEDTATTVSKVPARSYFWVNIRNTASKLTKISVSADVGVISTQEKTKIDAWLTQNTLNECGDPSGTVYSGGSCLFNETTGKTTDKYIYLVNKFPNRQWNNVCISNTNFLKLKNTPSTCLCATNYKIQVVKDETCPSGVAPKDCNVPQTVKCIPK